MKEILPTPNIWTVCMYTYVCMCVCVYMNVLYLLFRNDITVL